MHKVKLPFEHTSGVNSTRYLLVQMLPLLLPSDYVFLLSSLKS